MFIISYCIISQVGTRMVENTDNFIIRVTNFTKHPQYNNYNRTEVNFAVTYKCFHFLITALTR